MSHHKDENSSVSRQEKSTWQKFRGVKVHGVLAIALIALTGGFAAQALVGSNALQPIQSHASEGVVLGNTTSPQTGTIQGTFYATSNGGQVVPPTFVATLDGTTNATGNPSYSFSAVAAGSHRVSVTAPAGWNVGYTMCVSPTNCENNTPVNGTSAKFLLAAGSTMNISWHFDQTAPVPAPTATFSASPTTIQAGQSATLSWTTTNASSVSIDQGIGSVTPVASGSKSVNPSATTTYTLTATGPGGSVTKSTTVTVSQAVPAPTATFSASPTTIQAGQSATLSWTTTNATSASINQGIGSVTPVASGSRSVSPTATTTYTLTATGAGGSVTKSATVTVTTPPPGGSSLTLSSSNPTSITNPVNVAMPAKTFSASGGTTPYTWTLASGTLPNGVVLTSGTPSATLSGTPRTVGTYTFTLRVQDHSTPVKSATTPTITYVVQAAGVSHTLTITPNVGKPGAVSVDGDNGTNQNPDFATAHSVADCTDCSSRGIVTAETSVGYGAQHLYSVIRAALNFDTSSLGPNATITSATLTVVPQASHVDFSGTDFIRLVSNSFTTNNDYTFDDFNRFGASSLATNDANVLSMTSYGPVTFTLNAAGLANISKTGVSHFGIRTGRDVLNIAPIVGENPDFPDRGGTVVFMASADSGPTMAPKLVVTYTTPN